MKKRFLLTIISIGFLLSTNVYACGEIKNLKVEGATVTKLGLTNYLVTIKEGTSKVKLEAETDYDWVTGYEPREVSTNTDVELRVDGNKCGFGIYRHIISFKQISNVIAENPTDQPDNSVDSNLHNESNEGNVEQKLELQDITIEGYELDFVPNQYSYSLEVESNVNSLTILTTKVNETDNVTISNNAYNLIEGKNIVTISVSTTDGKESTYQIIVTRKKALSNNNFLASLTVSNYQINFDPSVTTYSVEITKESTLNITATTESELATYEIIGNENLNDASVITIRVTAEDSSTKDYIINIVKKETFNIVDYLIYIIIAVLTILLIVLIILNSKQKKNKKKIEPNEVDTPTETAGVVPTSITSVKEMQQPITEGAPIIQNQNNTLQMIQPTNIDNSTLTQNIETTNMQTLDEPTEVFKL